MSHHLLNPEQQDAVDTLQGPLLVIAGAGTGKTRVVTYRIANLLEKGVPSSSILGVTFTNKAAQEMKERVHALTNSHVLICTFHSLGARVLREMIHVLGYTRNFVIYDEQDMEKLVKLCLSEKETWAQIDHKLVINYISTSKNSLKIHGSEAAALAPEEDEKIFREIFEHYQGKLKEYNAVDFDDLLYLPVIIFKAHPEVLRHYQERWSHLLIDEYQDTNTVQYALVKLLVEKHSNICAVGDPDQSIYSWRGAKIQNILNFSSDFSGAKVIRLEQNYRSRENILEGSNALIGNNSTRFDKRLWSGRGAGEKIKRFTADTERMEAGFIAEKLRDYHEKYQMPLKNMVVFYRTNAQSRAIEDRMLMHRIPYVIVGGISFYQRREIKDILAFLRMVHSGGDFIAFSRTINIPKRGMGETTVEKIQAAATKEQRTILGYCQDMVHAVPQKFPVKLSKKQLEAMKNYVEIIHSLKEVEKACSLKELVTQAITLTGYLDYIRLDPETYQDRYENLGALIAKASEWELGLDKPTLEGFLEELSLKSTLDETQGDSDRISLMTIHNGKGLEFDLVFMVGMEEDLFPHANSRDNDYALEEERRLCYVGMTRAKEYLYMCDVRQRFLWGTTRSQRPSRFLKEVPSEYLERVSSAMSGGAFRHPHAVKEVYEEPKFLDEINQEVFEPEHLQVEDTVFHHDFGVGIIRAANVGSAGLIYKIFFSKDNRERSLVAKLAKLKKL